MTTKRSNVSRYILLFMGGALLYLAAVLPFLVYHGGIFFYYGDYNVQQVPFYILAHRAVRSGRFFWNPYIDLGGSMGGSLSFYLWGSPFFWLTIPFPEKMVPYLLPFVMSLRYGTAMVTSYAWIKRQVRDDFWAVIGSALYTFSGFQACNIVFQHFHDATAFFPLYLLTFDEIVQKRKPAGFTFMTALMAIINYYFFFGQVIFMVLYYLLRYFPVRGVQKALPEILYIILNGAAGILLASFFLVQSISGVSGNSRLDNYINGYDMIAYKDGTTPFAILKSLFVVPDIIAKPTLFSSDQVKNGSLAAYLPCFSLSGVIAYWSIFSGTWKKRMTVLCAVMALVPVLNAVYSAFNAGYYARWFYMPLLVLASMTARALETGRRKDLRRGARITAVITLAIMLCALLPVLEDGKIKWLSICDNMDLLVIECLSTAVQLMIMIFVLEALPGIKGAAKYRRTVLLAATLISCLLTNWAVLYNGNSLIAKTGGVKWKQQMLDSKPSLRDTSTFFRVETDGTSTNYEMVWGYPTIHCFESTVSPSIFTFYRKIGMIRTVESTLPIDRIGARALLSVRYYIQNELVRPSETLEDKGGMPGYEEGIPDGGYRIYENMNYIPMGFTFTTYLREEEYDDMRKGEMTDRLLVKDLILTEEQVARYGRYMEEDQHADEETMSDQEFERACSKRRESACSEFAFDNTGFAARISLPSENLVFFSVPYDEGFTAQVDGLEVPVEKVDGGLMAVPVPAGDHEIRFTYLPKGFRIACLISAITAIVLIVLSVRRNVRAQKTNVLAIKNNA